MISKGIMADGPALGKLQREPHCGIIAQATASNELEIVVIVTARGNRPLTKYTTLCAPLPMRSPPNSPARPRASPRSSCALPLRICCKPPGAAMGRNIVCVGEVRLRHRLGKPDYGIAEGGLLTGYVELKAPGKGVVRRRFAGHDLEQFDRFAQLPNVLYTDGNEWALYRYGQRERPPVRLAGDVAARAPRLTVTIARRELRSWLRQSPAGQSVEAVVKSLLQG